jgi:hypothetical protein
MGVFMPAELSGALVLTPWLIGLEDVRDDAVASWVTFSV